MVQITETCKQLIALLTDFLEGELDAARCHQIEAHLATCPYCHAVVDTTLKTLALYHGAPREPMPEQVKQHLVEVLGLAKNSTE